MSKPKDRFAGFEASSKDGGALELVCLGLPCTLFEDYDVARLMEDEGHLQSWLGIQVDRYDARLLLDSLKQFDDDGSSTSSSSDDEDLHGTRGRMSMQEREEEALIEAERYRDLHAAQARSLERRGDDHREAKDRAGTSYGACGDVAVVREVLQASGESPSEVSTPLCPLTCLVPHTTEAPFSQGLPHAVLERQGVWTVEGLAACAKPCAVP